MAWIKVETNLFEKPEVMSLAKALRLRATAAVGLLIRFWCVIDALTEDGFIPLYDEGIVDRVVGVKGFARALVSVGWIEFRETGAFVPRFDKHNGSSAKRRSETAIRVGKMRKRRYEKEVACEAECNAPCVTGVTKVGNKMVTREEKRRIVLSSESTMGAHANDFEPPDEDEVRRFSEERGWAWEEVWKWQLFHRSQGWVCKNGRRMVDWRSNLELWMVRGEELREQMPDVTAEIPAGRRPVDVMLD